MQADTLFSGPVVQDTVITTEPEAAADTAVVSISEATDEALGTVEGFLTGFYEMLPRLAVALVVLAFFWLLARGVRGIVHRVTPGPTDAPIGIVLGRLTYAGILFLGVLVSLVVVFPTFTVGGLVGALGIGGIAIGFAFQDIFQNLLAGILILLRQPFKTGDEIISGGYVGKVESIETRATFIRTYDGQRVIIPNSQIYSDPVTVITAYDMVRSEYDVGIGYGDDIETAKRVALKTMQGVEGVLKDPAPDVLTWDLAGSSVNLRIRWWTNPTRSSVVAVRDRVLKATTAAMAAESIDLPFPTQVVLFHDQTEETDGDRSRQREGWPVPKGGPAPKPARLA
ncbi:MAG: mechanosensitive ion channel domain-containing protein [Bacteroidota bacterium]